MLTTMWLSELISTCIHSKRNNENVGCVKYFNIIYIYIYWLSACTYTYVRGKQLVVIVRLIEVHADD